MEICDDAKAPNFSANSARCCSSVWPFAASSESSAEHVDRGRDAVLVAHLVGVHEVAERLLVAVGEAAGAGDPLEAGERLGEVEPVLGGDLSERGRAHDRAGESAVRRRRARDVARPASRAASPPRCRSAAASRPSASGSGIPTARRSASGSLAMIELRRRHAVAVANARSIAPGSSGFGKETVGKVGSGSSCSATVIGVGEAGRLEHASRGLPPDAVQGRVDEAERRRVRHQGGGACDVLVDERLVGGLVAVSRGRSVIGLAATCEDLRLRSRRRRARRSAIRRRVRRGTPCSRCRRPGCGWPSP